MELYFSPVNFGRFAVWMTAKKTETSFIMRAKHIYNNLFGVEFFFPFLPTSRITINKEVILKERPNIYGSEWSAR